MTDDPVRTARELLKAATPGPWAAWHDKENVTWWVDSPNVPDERLSSAVAETGEHQHGPEDAALIAAAPDLLARLADEVERLREADRAATLVNDEVHAALVKEVIRADKAEDERDRLSAAVVELTKAKEAAEGRAEAVQMQMREDAAVTESWMDRANAAEAALAEANTIIHDQADDIVRYRHELAKMRPKVSEELLLERAEAAEARVRELESTAEHTAECGEAMGRIDERAAVVAWLRKGGASPTEATMLSARRRGSEFADAIEAGAHRGEGGAMQARERCLAHGLRFCSGCGGQG